MGNPYPFELADASSGVVKIAGKATFTDPANQPGGGSQTLRQGTPVVLNNAALLSLPTTTVPEIVPAPGANKIAIPTMVVIRTAFTVAYTGSDDDGADMGIYWDDGNSSALWSNLISNANTAYGVRDLRTLLLTTGPRVVLLTPNKDAQNDVTQATGNPPLPRQPNMDEGVMPDTHLILYVANGADFGGGDAANTMTIVPYYVVLDV